VIQARNFSAGISMQPGAAQAIMADGRRCDVLFFVGTSAARLIPIAKSNRDRGLQLPSAA